MNVDGRPQRVKGGRRLQTIRQLLRVGGITREFACLISIPEDHEIPALGVGPVIYDLGNAEYYSVRSAHGRPSSRLNRAISRAGSVPTRGTGGRMASADGEPTGAVGGCSVPYRTRCGAPVSSGTTIS